MTKATWITIAVVAAIILAAGGFTWWQGQQPGRLDGFAQCLTEKGVKFYGAFWCPHCQNEKHVFGNSAKYLPYIECSTPDSNGQLQVCADANVKNYPTWEFPDKSRQEGEIDLQTLAEKSGCVLPQ